MAMDELHPLERVSEVNILREQTDWMQDPYVEEAMDLVIKYVSSKELPNPVKAAKLVLTLQGLSAYFAIQATTFATTQKDRAGSENNNKKNMYYTLSDHMDKLAAAMKIIAKVNQL